MNQSTPPAVGIDLGTTFSLVAHLDSAGRPWSIPNAEGDLLTPSVVLFEGSSVVVGKEAVKAAAMEPERIAQFAKRDMGNAVYSKVINGEHLPPEVIQAMILEKLKVDAEAKLGPFQKVVITVPAYFNEPRRKATQDAGHLAGLEVMDIINEPTAAALAFGVEQGFLTLKGESKQAEKILVYDLGGGTFDVTLMDIDGKNCTVLATAGDVYLGGIDWDQRIADFVAEQFQAKFRGIDPRKNPAGLQRLLREAEDAKRALSAREKATISFEYGGEGIRVPITRQHFEKITADLLERTRFTTCQLLKDAGLGWDAITRLLLVGGSSRMPMVQNMLEQESGRKVDRSLSFDEAVAHGAAIYAGLLLASGPARKVNIRNVNSHSLGVLGKDPNTGRNRNRIMVPRNTPLPVTKRAIFKTFRSNQREVVVNVIEGGDASGNNSTSIGKCVLRDLPPNLPAGSLVEVEFTYTENGRLEVKARLPKSNIQAHIRIERETGLSDDTLQDWGRRLKGKAPVPANAAISAPDEPLLAEVTVVYRGGHPAVAQQVQGFLRLYPSSLCFVAADKRHCISFPFASIIDIPAPAMGCLPDNLANAAQITQAVAQAGKIATGLAGEMLGGVSAQVVKALVAQAESALQNQGTGGTTRNRLPISLKEGIGAHFDVVAPTPNEMEGQAKAFWERIDLVRKTVSRMNPGLGWR